MPQCIPQSPAHTRTPPAVLQGSLQRQKEGLPGEDAGAVCQLLLSSAYHPVLFCALQPRKALNEGLVNMQLSHPASFQDTPVAACSFLSIWTPALTPGTTVWDQGSRTKRPDRLPHKANGPHPSERQPKQTAHPCPTRAKKSQKANTPLCPALGPAWCSFIFRSLNKLQIPR